MTKAAKSKTRSYMLECKISAGLFTNEVYVVIELPNGTTFTAAADKSQIILGKGVALTQDGLTSGAIKVSVLKAQPGGFLVDLHRETFSGGSRMVVPKNMVRAVA